MEREKDAQREREREENMFDSIKTQRQEKLSEGGKAEPTKPLM